MYSISERGRAAQLDQFEFFASTVPVPSGPGHGGSGEDDNATYALGGLEIFYSMGGLHMIYGLLTLPATRPSDVYRWNSERTHESYLTPPSKVSVYAYSMLSYAVQFSITYIFYL